MNIEERIKNDLHNFLVKVEEGRKEHSPAMDVEAYLIDMFAKQMATGVLLEISLHDKELIEKIEGSMWTQEQIENAPTETKKDERIAQNYILNHVLSLFKQNK